MGAHTNYIWVYILFFQIFPGKGTANKFQKTSIFWKYVSIISYFMHLNIVFISEIQ